MIRASYYCSQSALYKVSKKVLHALSEHLHDFSEFKGKYNQEFLVETHSTLSLAESMPDFQTRGSKSVIHFTELNDAFAECSALWQKLKRYIQSAYPSEEHRERLEQAGAGYYKKANLKNWDAARSLFLAAQNFLNTEHPTLAARQNMPVSFRTTFITAHVNFSRLMLKYHQADEKMKIETVNKLKANNLLFAQITEICLDGQRIFKTQPAIKARFTFSRLLDLIEGPKGRTKVSKVSDNSTASNLAPPELPSPHMDGIGESH